MAEGRRHRDCYGIHHAPTSSRDSDRTLGDHVLLQSRPLPSQAPELSRVSRAPRGAAGDGGARLRWLRAGRGRRRPPRAGPWRRRPLAEGALAQPGRERAARLVRRRRLDRLRRDLRRSGLAPGGGPRPRTRRARARLRGASQPRARRAARPAGVLVRARDVRVPRPQAPGRARHARRAATEQRPARAPLHHRARAGRAPAASSRGTASTTRASWAAATAWAWPPRSESSTTPARASG